MKKYESIDIEISAIKIDDIVTASVVKRQDSGVDAPWMKVDPDGEVY